MSYREVEAGVDHPERKARSGGTRSRVLWNTRARALAEREALRTAVKLCTAIGKELGYTQLHGSFTVAVRGSFTVILSVAGHGSMEPFVGAGGGLGHAFEGDAAIAGQEASGALGG